MQATLAAAGGRLTDAAVAAFGYSDTATLAIMREAVEVEVDRANI